MKYFILIIVLFVTCMANAQENVGTLSFDTLIFTDKTNGTLDSIDAQSRSSSMVFPFISGASSASFLNPFTQYLPAGSVYHTPFSKRSQLYFSAIPHIGVAYTFGSQGAQHLTFNYSQVFRKDLLVNLSFNNNATAGFYRNSAWESKAYSLGIAKNSSCYSFRFNADFSQENRGLSNGIVSDSLASLFSLTLIPVRKEDAFSNATIRNIGLMNYIDFNMKDSSRFAGIIMESKLRSLDRYYHESDQLNSLYSLIQYDSITTSDHYGIVDFTNQFGMGFLSRNLATKAFVSANYWRYSNQGMLRDTLEIGLMFSLALKLKNWQLNSRSSYNLLGAKNSWSLISSATWKKNSHYVLLENSNNNSAPLPFQRFYQANNISYSLPNFNLQRSYSLKGLFQEKFSKHYVAFSYEWLSTKQVYVYNGQAWASNSAMSQQVLHQFGVLGTFKFGSFAFSPNYQLTLMDEDYRFHPMHTISNRILVKGGIFKAKKLKALAALDLFYSSKYKAPRIIPTMTSVDYSGLPSAIFQKSMLNAGLLIGIEIETFRFFARLDNIAYFITDRSQLFYEGYTIPTWQVKFGITWDFWN